MKEKLFYSGGFSLGYDSANSERVLRRQGLVLDFSTLYSFTSMPRRGIRFAVVRNAVHSIFGFVNRLVSRLFDAFLIVLSSRAV